MDYKPAVSAQCGLRLRFPVRVKSSEPVEPASRSLGISFMIFVGAIQTSINIYLQAWTTSLPGGARSQYGVFLGGSTGMQIVYLVCVYQRNL